MGIPAHIQLVTGIFGATFFVLGMRDIFMPGYALPMPGDGELVAAFFGPLPVGSCGKKDVSCLPGKMLMLSQMWGVLLACVAAVKLAVVFSHPEGTFLRRNLFVVFGAFDLLMAYIGNSHAAYLATQGASVTPFVAGLCLEGVLFLQDALMRPREMKKVK